MCFSSILILTKYSVMSMIQSNCVCSTETSNFHLESEKFFFKKEDFAIF